MTEYDEIGKWYDLLYPELKQSKYDFYNDLIKKNQPALEIGCGSGKLYLKYLEQGYDVYGLDISQIMIQSIIDKSTDLKPKLFHDNVVNMDLNKKFNLIYYPSNSITHHTSVNELIKVFENCYNHLNDNGVFAFDLFVPSFDKINNYGEINTLTKEIDDETHIIGKWSKIINKVEQLFNLNWMIINKNTGKKLLDENITLSLLPKQQIEILLAKTGFSNYHFYNNFTNDEINKDSSYYSVVAQK